MQQQQQQQQQMIFFIIFVVLLEDQGLSEKVFLKNNKYIFVFF